MHGGLSRTTTRAGDELSPAGQTFGGRKKWGRNEGNFYPVLVVDDDTVSPSPPFGVSKTGRLAATASRLRRAGQLSSSETRGQS